MAYRIKIDRRAAKSISKLPKNISDRVIRAVRDLAENPHPVGSRKIQGAADTYRIKVAQSYRVVYQLKNEELLIIVIGAGHRKDIYRKL